MTETNTESVAVAASAIEALNAGDTERFLDHIADDVRFWMNGSHQFSGTLEGKAAFVELLGRVGEGLSEMITLEVLQMIPAGDWVVIETQGSATTASGKPYGNRYCMLWRVRDGKLCEFKEYSDSQLIIESFPTS